MSSRIEWTDETWNPTIGCSPVSKGCRNCYAARESIRLAGRFDHYKGLARSRSTGGAVFTGAVKLMEGRLEQPLRWRKPRRVFVDSMSDLFHPGVPDDFIDHVFAVMALSPSHTFQVLTKRPERMVAYVSIVDGWRRYTTWAANGSRLLRGLNRKDQATGVPPRWPLPNIWLGTSVEDQAAGDERIPHLLRTPAAVRFLSCEPLLGPLDLGTWVHPPRRGKIAFTTTPETHPEDAPVTIRSDLIQWIIVGGESGPNARPMHPDWVRSLHDQCRAAGVPFFMKQGSGSRPGKQYDLPDDLWQVKEYPHASR